MRKITTLSSVFLLGTTFGLLFKNLLLTSNLKMSLQEDEHPLYL